MAPWQESAREGSSSSPAPGGASRRTPRLRRRGALVVVNESAPTDGSGGSPLRPRRGRGDRGGRHTPSSTATRRRLGRGRAVGGHGRRVFGASTCRHNAGFVRDACFSCSERGGPVIGCTLRGTSACRATPQPVGIGRRPRARAWTPDHQHLVVGGDPGLGGSVVVLVGQAASHAHAGAGRELGRYGVTATPSPGRPPRMTEGVFSEMMAEVGRASSTRWTRPTCPFVVWLGSPQSAGSPAALRGGGRQASVAEGWQHGPAAEPAVAGCPPRSVPPSSPSWPIRPPAPSTAPDPDPTPPPPRSVGRGGSAASAAPNGEGLRGGMND